MKKIFTILGSITALMTVIFLAYIKREGDKHAIISSVLNEMGGYEF